MINELTPAIAAIISALIQEHSSELDLHYEDHEADALEPSLQALSAAAELLRQHGYAVPEVYNHILLRFGAVKHC